MGRGAGGTNGGVGRFLIGFFMMCGGFYLLLQSITVSSALGFGLPLYGGSLGGHTFAITTGMVMVPFIFGTGIIFYNAKNPLGWVLALGALAAMVYGVIASTRFSLRSMTAFELITILVLCFGGIGLFLSSFRDFEKRLNGYEQDGDSPAR